MPHRSIKPAPTSPGRSILAGEGDRVVFGQLDLGVRAESEPAYRLVYAPKTILGDAFAVSSRLGKAVPAEIVPVGRVGSVKFRVLAGGKPSPKTTITVILPDGNQKEVETDAKGETPAFSETGRYGRMGALRDRRGG